MLDDVTSLTLQTAVAGLSARQQVTANNIANLETPNYIANSVSFEDSLAEAVGDDEPLSTQLTTTPSPLNPGLNGNNVNLSDEVVTATKTTLQSKLMSTALTQHYGLLSTVLKG